MDINPSAKKYLRSKTFKLIKADLVDQLERNGAVGKFYLDLINDYMDLWVTKCLLVDDIQARGVSIVYENGGGQRGVKKNDSIEQRIKVNAQMLKILSELEIKPSTSYGNIGGDEDEPEEERL